MPLRHTFPRLSTRILLLTLLFFVLLFASSSSSVEARKRSRRTASIARIANAVLKVAAENQPPPPASTNTQTPATSTSESTSKSSEATSSDTKHQPRPNPSNPTVSNHGSSALGIIFFILLLFIGCIASYVCYLRFWRGVRSADMIELIKEQYEEMRGERYQQVEDGSVRGNGGGGGGGAYSAINTLHHNNNRRELYAGLPVSQYPVAFPPRQSIDLPVRSAGGENAPLRGSGSSSSLSAATPLHPSSQQQHQQQQQGYPPARFSVDDDNDIGDEPRYYSDH